MRKQDTIQVGDKPITVYEMTPKEVILILPLLKGLYGKEEFTEADLIDLFIKNYDNIKDIFINCTSVKQEILGFGISSLIPIIKAFIKVNRSFFVQARKELLEKS